MEIHDDILKELEDISPKLAEIPRQDPFTVNEAYLAQLHEATMKRIRNEQKDDNVIRGHLFHHSAIKWAAASIVILVLGSGYYYLAWNSFYDRKSATEAYVLENVDEEIMTDYVAEIPTKAGKKNESIDNSLENIDEEIIIEGL